MIRNWITRLEQFRKFVFMANVTGARSCKATFRAKDRADRSTSPGFAETRPIFSWMARPLRIELADGVYHITTRGNERKAIYRDDADRETFLATLDETRSRFGWLILCYCLMGNHYHLLARTPRPNLARGMGHLNGVYAKRFNRRHRRVGHLFQARYHAVLVQQDEHLLATVGYIVNNPVRAHIVATCEQWRWSSHRATLGKRPPGLLDLDALLRHFDERDRSRARHATATSSTRPSTHPPPPGLCWGATRSPPP